MKIRIRGNSLRLRLTQSEVEAFYQNGFYEESCNFSLENDQQLKYRLERNSSLNNPSAQMDKGTISVYLPAEEANRWASGNEVGIEYLKNPGTEHELRILVEKDFQCLKPRAEEDEADNFPNPQALT